MTFKHALIVGSGIAGLMAARVASKYFRQVCLIEADEEPIAAAPRHGVGQGRHLHTLLPGGLEILRAYFSTLEKDLDVAGGRVAGPADWFAETSNGRTYRLSRFQPTPLPDREDHVPLRIQTRPLLELKIRQAVTSIPNVQVQYGRKVQTFLMQGEKVSGVVFADGTQISDADLVIDASGRNSVLLGWLEEHGLCPPRQSEIGYDVGYASALARPVDVSLLNEGGFLVPSARIGPYTKRAGSVARVEDDLYLFTLSGRFGDYPPKAEDGFRAYTETLSHPHLHELLAQSEIVDGPSTYLIPKSVRRHFDQLDTFPAGLLVIGDIICHLNPAYGQGMSLACRQAVCLDEILSACRNGDHDPARIWKPFFKAALEQCRAPWVFAAMMDFNKKETKGDFPSEEKAAIETLKALSRKADKGDLEAARLVDDIFDMRLPLSALSDS